jgi:hypothetical protein
VDYEPRPGTESFSSQVSSFAKLVVGDHEATEARSAVYGSQRRTRSQSSARDGATAIERRGGHKRQSR